MTRQKENEISNTNTHPDSDPTCSCILTQDDLQETWKKKE